MSKQTYQKKPMAWHVVGRNSRIRYFSFQTEHQAQRCATRMEKEEFVPKGTYQVINMKV